MNMPIRSLWCSLLFLLIIDMGTAVHRKSMYLIKIAISIDAWSMKKTSLNQLKEIHIEQKMYDDIGRMFNFVG